MKNMAEIVSTCIHDHLSIPMSCTCTVCIYSKLEIPEITCNSPLGRRLFEEDNPLVISLEASVTNRNSKLVLRDNTYSTIQWDAFTQPELNNFILILRREEELYMEKVRVCSNKKTMCALNRKSRSVL